MSALDGSIPNFEFTIDPTIASFSIPVQTYLTEHRNEKLGQKYYFLAASAYVIDSSTPPRILLIQRATSDSMPGRWEVPGGACDDEDATVLHSVARELWEEAGLIATKIGPEIGDGHVVLTRSGRMVCKFGFLVEPQKVDAGALHVKLDPREHQNHVWATEEEVRAYRAGGTALEFTHEEQKQAILRAFEIGRRLG